MPLVGRGRIVVWEGASLWILRSAQQKADLQPHAHHAIQITFQLEGDFEIGVVGRRLKGPIAAVWSDTLHGFRAHGAVAFLFIAPESSAGRALHKLWFSDHPWKSGIGAPLNEMIGDLSASLNEDFGDDTLLAIGRRMLECMPKAEEQALPDPRVRRMISYVRQNLDQAISLTAAADHVCLSQSRARHLFVEQTGLPFKTYLLWARLENAVELYAKGSSLTEAAHIAGFADSAHLSRTFRRTFGLPAAALYLD